MAGAALLSGFAVFGFTSPASAAVTAANLKATSSGAPPITPTGANQPAANVTLNITGGAAVTGTSADSVTFKSSGATVFSTTPTLTVTQTGVGTAPTFAAPTGVGTNTLTYKVTNAWNEPATTSAALTLSGITYTTTAATVGAITVTASYVNVPGATVAPAAVANATVVAAVAGSGTITSPTPAPGDIAKLAAQPGGPVTYTITGATGGTTLKTGDKIVSTVTDSAGLPVTITSTAAATISGTNATLPTAAAEANATNVDTMTLTVPGGTITVAAGKTVSITIPSFVYNLSTTPNVAPGPITVYANYVGVAGSSNFAFTPSTGAVNATILAPNTPGSGSIVATANAAGNTAPPIFPSKATQAAGNLTITLSPGDEIQAGDKVAITVADSTGAATINWANVPNFTVMPTPGTTSPCIAGVTSSAPTQCPATSAPTTAPAIAGGTLTFFLNNASTANAPFILTAPQTIVLSNVNYTTTAAVAGGPVKITATYTSVTAAFSFTFTTGNPASNAVVNNGPAVVLTALADPLIPVTASSSGAGPWTLQLNGVAGSTVINNGDRIDIAVDPNNGDANNCSTVGAPDAVGFAGVPASITVSATNSAITNPLPTVTAAVTASGKCVGNAFGITNELVLTLNLPAATPTDTFTGPGPTGLTITLGGISYYTNRAVAGQVAVSTGYNLGAGVQPAPSSTATVSPGPPPATNPAKGTPITGNPSNAIVGGPNVTVSGNSPITDIQLLSVNGTHNSAQNQPISPIKITEGAAGQLTSGAFGYVCVALNGGVEWNAAETPTATASGGGLAVSPLVTTESTGSQTGAGTIEFQVTTSSTTGPATITLNNLFVNVPAAAGVVTPGTGTVSVTFNGTNPICTGGSAAITNPTVVFNVSLRIGGSDADATADQACDILFPLGFNGGVPYANPVLGAPVPTFTVVLATDSDYQDALSASYLAGTLGTCVLLTPTAALSAETLQTIQFLGATNVDVVGGPMAVSPAALAQLAATPEWQPGGIVEQYQPNTNNPKLLVVQEIYGATADGTAQAVAQSVPHDPSALAFPGAYVGNAYNDTTGISASPAASAPDFPVTTAILATDNGFQDAASASVLAYGGITATSPTTGKKVTLTPMPLLLTGQASLAPEAQAALLNLGIQQLIVMGGPVAISDTVVQQVEALGIAVLRIAGQDFQDTSQLLAQFELNTTNVAGQATGLAFGGPGALTQPLSFARGDYYSDAIVAAEVASGISSPILLTENPTTVGPELTTFLGIEGNPATAYGARGRPVSTENVFGQTLAITTALETALAQAL
jgi:hypothetical protein